MERQRADRTGLATARLVLVLAVLTGALFSPGLTELTWSCFWVQETPHGKQAVYRGLRNISASGFICQHWGRAPHDLSLPQGETAQEASNYCRDPDFFGLPWCWLRDRPHVREVCHVPYCDSRQDGGWESLFNCYTASGGAFPHALYLGSMSLSNSNKFCQPWHKVKDAILHSKMLSLHGLHDLRRLGAYCRDMTGRGYPWCYTDLVNLTWELCPVLECPSDFSRPPDPAFTASRPWLLLPDYYALTDSQKNMEADCFWLEMEATYTHAVYAGSRNTTASGLTCLPWTRFVDRHAFVVGETPQESANYCRDPNFFGIPWCYTKEHDGKMDICDIPYCTSRSDKGKRQSVNECYVVAKWGGFSRALYFGLANSTLTGEECQPWSKVTDPDLKQQMYFLQRGLDPRVQGNFCRDMQGHGVLSCLVDPVSHRLSLCDVTQCPEGSVGSAPDFRDVSREDLLQWVQVRESALASLLQQEQHEQQTEELQTQSSSTGSLEGNGQEGRESQQRQEGQWKQQQRHATSHSPRVEALQGFEMSCLLVAMLGQSWL